MALEILDVDISKNCNNGMIYSYDTSSILDVAHDIEMSTKTILEIAEKLSVLPLTLQLANIYGNLW